MAEASARPQRFEAKYRVSELQAQAIRNFVIPYVAVDAHVLQGAEYPVNSLYFDTPSLRLHRDSLEGRKNRFKLRIRNYSNAPDGAAFIEIKRRIDQVVSKRRSRVTSAEAGRFLSGEHDWHASQNGNGGWDAVSEFQGLADRIGAFPVAYVRYSREAYVSRMEDGVRVTFDRRIECAPYDPGHPQVWTDDGDWRLLDIPDVVLEIKFTGGFPHWVQQLVRRFNLMRCSMAKYVASMETLEREGLRVGLGAGRIA